MSAVKDLTFRLLGKDDSASAALDKLAGKGQQVSAQFERSFSKTKAVFGGVALAAAGAVAMIAKTGIGEAMDASAGMAQLQAGIKSTGGVAGVTVGHMEDLASTIQGYSGQTDDSIVATEKLLLTFTNIRNNGPDKIFDLTTKAAADMAAKMGGDASSKAVMLGKALNDPEKGLAKLTKVGVTFTDAQKAQVAAMVKAGDTAGAQKVILGELSREFGGAAKAAGESLPGQLQRMQRAFEDVSQTVVEAILPVVTPAIGKITSAIKASTPTLMSWAKGFAQVAQWVAANLPLIVTMAGVVVGLVAAYKAFSAVMAVVRMVTVLASAAQVVFNIALSANPIGIIVVAIAALVGGLIWFFTQTKLGQQIWAGFTAALANGWRQLVAGLNVVVGVLATGWNAVVGFVRTAVGNVLGFLRTWGPGILAVIAPVIGIPILIAQHWNEIVAVARRVWAAVTGAVNAGISAVRGVVTVVVSWVVGYWRTGWNNLTAVVRVVWGAIVAVVRGYIAVVRAVVTAVVTGVVTLWRTGWNNLTTVVRTVWNAIVGVISPAISRIRAAVTAGVNGVRAVWTSVWNAVSAAVRTVWNAISATVSAAISRVRSYVTTGVNAVRSAWQTGMNAVRSVVTTVWNAIASFVSSSISRVRSYVATGVNTIRSVWQAGMNAVRTVVTTVWNAIASFISTVIGRVRSIVTSGISTVRSVVSTGLNAVLSMFRSIWNTVVSTISSAVGRAVSVVRSMGSQILSAVTSIASRMFSAGAAIVNGLANGIRSAVGAATSAIKGVISAVTNFLPHSPAKEGPLSGRGWTPYSGAALTRGLAEGMNSEVGTVRAAGLNVATAASITPTLGLASRRPAPAAAGPAALAGRAPWQAPAGNGPLVAIENFHAHGQSPDDVAAALAWQLRVPF